MAAPNQVGDNVPVQTATALPRAFGNYLLFDRIGRGGMAEIFLTRTHTEFGGSRRVEMGAGAAYSRGEGVEHNVVNGGGQPMSFVEVELKN